MSNKQSWENIAAGKRDALLASIPQEWIIPKDIFPSESQLNVTTFPRQSGWFTPSELEITDSTANQIVQKTSTGAWTAVEVTRAFCKRAAAAHQLTNCLSETLFTEALESAKALDAHFAATARPIGPLHGLPVSLKDNFNIVGKDSTIGFTSFANEPATYNSVMTDMLRDAGAVIYVKTNVPTAMMIAETVNNVFGLTTNPLNRLMSAGGSSGGESALVAFGGSPLGVGSDIGGSLRIPSACTGIFTIRPSAGRFPNALMRGGLVGQESVLSVIGPMARTLDAVELWSSAVVNSQPWLRDPKCLPIPWRSVTRKAKLKIGVIWDDGFVRPTPPVRRALKETVEKLKKAGHEIVNWEPFKHKDMLKLLLAFFTSDGGTSLKKILERTGEPIRPELVHYDKATDNGVYNLWQLQTERNIIQKEYIDRFNAAQVDALLGPTTPFASIEHSKLTYVGFTAVFNLLDYSAISFPCGVNVDQAVDTSVAAAETPLSDFDTVVQQSYNASTAHGLPVSLQLTGRRLDEENVIMMGKVVLDALQSSSSARL